MRPRRPAAAGQGLQLAGRLPGRRLVHRRRPGRHGHLARRDAGRATPAPPTWPPRPCCPLDGPGEHVDVFSLGAIAYHVFAGGAAGGRPAGAGREAAGRPRPADQRRPQRGRPAACRSWSSAAPTPTWPAASTRRPTSSSYLDDVEDELTAPATDTLDDPLPAQKGDRLAGRLRRPKRLGQGASSVALLVERDGEEFVLKVANAEDHARRLRDEGEVLGKLRTSYIVESARDAGDRRPRRFLVLPAYGREGRRDAGQRLRKEGRLHVDLLQRFGEDLLEVVKYLEEQGIPHRDIKPDNIGVGRSAAGDQLHLVLFDFSLSRTPPENIEAGTKAYLDPFLPLRKRVGPGRRAVRGRRDALRDGHRDAARAGATAAASRRSWSARPPSTPSCSTRPCGRRWCRSSARPCGGTPPSGSTTPRRCCRQWRECFEVIGPAGRRRGAGRGGAAAAAGGGDVRLVHPRAGPGHAGDQRPGPGQRADRRGPARDADAAAAAAAGRRQQDAAGDRRGGQDPAGAAGQPARRAAEQAEDAEEQPTGDLSRS